GGDNPIGRRVSYGPDGPAADWHEIIGVVGDVRHADLTTPPNPRAYDLLGEHATLTLFVVTRGVLDAAAASRAVPGAVHRHDAAAPVFDVTTLDRIVADRTAPRWTAAAFAAATASLALLLAAVGVYALLAGAVASRTREMGIRRALGCPEGALVALVLRAGAALAGAGAAVGGAR